MTRPIVFTDANRLWPAARRLTLACAAVSAMAFSIWWVVSPATAEHAPLAPPATTVWAGSASPFAQSSAGPTTPVPAATAPPLTPAQTAPPLPPTPPSTAAPALTWGPPVVHVSPMNAPTGMAGARGGAETPDTEAEN